MDLQLTGKRALVTGGSRGIGFAIASALAGEGADVALLARDQVRLETARQQLAAAHGRRVLALPADTTDDAAVRAAIGRTADELGGIDILVNNAAEPAGPGSPRALADLADADLLAAFDAKVLGYLRCARAAAPHMAAQGWGRIINISGLAARSTGTPSGSIRNIAIAALAKTLADELGPAGINVTVVHPGHDGDRAHPGPDGGLRRRARPLRGRGGGGHGRADQHWPHRHRRRGGRRRRLPRLAAQRRHHRRRHRSWRRHAGGYPLLAGGLAGRSVAVQGAFPVGAGGGSGAVAVQGEGPAPLVDGDEVVEGT